MYQYGIPHPLKPDQIDDHISGMGERSLTKAEIRLPERRKRTLYSEWLL